MKIFNDLCTENKRKKPVNSVWVQEVMKWWWFFFKCVYKKSPFDFNVAQARRLGLGWVKKNINQTHFAKLAT